MRGRPPAFSDYGWTDAEQDLGEGIHPEVVAARLGEPVDHVLEVADRQGWPITWKGPTPDEIIDYHRQYLT